jgi:probable HAF family extracellular repeat protein
MGDRLTAWTASVRRRRASDAAEARGASCPRGHGRQSMAGRAAAAAGLALILFGACLNLPATAAAFSVTDLGTLGGKTSVAFAINARGQVVGWSNTAGSPLPRAFLWEGGLLRDLGTLGGQSSVAFGLDDLGRVVGVATTSGDEAFRAFLLDDTGMHDLGTLGGSYSRAYGLNNAGQVVGVSTTGEGDYHAFLVDGGAMHDLGTLGGTFSVATGINSLGQIIGDTTQEGEWPRRAFIAGSSQSVLGTLGGEDSSAHGINSQGHVVGEASTLLDPFPHAFLHDGIQMRDLGTLGGTSSRAFGINDLAQIVGGSTTTDDAEEHAFVYSNGRMTDLNALLPPDSGWILTQAQAINSAGQIVGSGQFGGQSRAFLLTPLPVAAPSGLTTIPGLPTRVTLAWTDNSDNETAFVIERMAAGGDFAVIGRVDADVTQFVDETATPATLFTYRVRAAHPVAQSEYSGEGSLETFPNPPSAPADLTAVAASGSEVQLSWTDSSDNETGFEVRRRGGEAEFDAVAVLPAGVTTFTDGGLSPDIFYSYQVRAVNPGGISEWSGEARSYVVLPAPVAPSGLMATATSAQQIDLSWTDNSHNEFAFAIWRKSGAGDWTRIAVVAPNVTRHVDLDVTSDVPYTYQIRAINNGGASDWSNEAISYVLLPAPLSPSGLTATAVSGGQIDLSWTDNSHNEFAFALWRRAGTGDYQRVGVVPPNVTTFSDTTVGLDTLYTYRVRAVNNGGASDWSNDAKSFALLPAPAAPSGLKAAVVGSWQIDLTWADNSHNEFAFAIWRKSGAGDWTRIAVVPPDVTAYSDRDVIPEAQYVYRIRATNNGASDWTAEVSAATLPPAPPAPTDLKLRVAAPGQVTFTWSDNSSSETGFELYRHTGDGDFRLLVVLAPNTRLFQDTNLAPGRHYSYRVRAVGVGGVSGWSNEISWTTPASP